MVPDQKTPKEAKNVFLARNPKYKEIVDDNQALGDFFSINDDDEVWLMQCPKGSQVSLLQDQKIKLPGRSNHNEIETIATEYSEPVPHAFGYKNKKAHNSVKIVPVRGSIIMRNRLKLLAPPDASESEVTSLRVPMPVGIKQRHPLHGVDFARKLTICPQVAERLKHVYEASPQKQKSKKKSKEKSNETNTIAIDSDGEVELVLQKKQKQKKKKRKHSSGDDDNEVPTKKKKGKKTSQIEDVPEDLQWIQKLRE